MEPSSTINDDLKTKPTLRKHTPVVAIIKGNFLDESFSSKSNEIFRGFIYRILKHNQSNVIEHVIDKRKPIPSFNNNKIKSNLAPMTLQTEPSVLSVPISEPPVTTEPTLPTPEVLGGQKKGRTSKQNVKTKTLSKKNKK